MRKRFKFNRGLTLIELLIVISFLSLIFGLLTPIFIKFYQNYKENFMLDELVNYLNQVRRDSFYYNRDQILYEKNNKLYINNKHYKKSELSFIIEEPIYFYKHGTTSGGVIYVIINNNKYKITVKYPFGEISYEKI